MDVRRTIGPRPIHRFLATLALFGAVGGLDVLSASSAGASSRPALVATTSSGSGGVLLALGCAVLVLGIVGFVVFTYARRKRAPGRCAAQRDALELAEKSVQYWEAARAHLETVERQRTAVESSPDDASTHAALVAKAADGMRLAMQQRDQCQMELIRCMASGVPAVPVIPESPGPSQPFFTPDNDGPSSRLPD
jgi:hypothetical protein